MGGQKSEEHVQSRAGGSSGMVPDTGALAQVWVCTLTAHAAAQLESLQVFQKTQTL